MPFICRKTFTIFIILFQISKSITLDCDVYKKESDCIKFSTESCMWCVYDSAEENVNGRCINYFPCNTTEINICDKYVLPKDPLTCDAYQNQLFVLVNSCNIFVAVVLLCVGIFVKENKRLKNFILSFFVFYIVDFLLALVLYLYFPDDVNMRETSIKISIIPFVISCSIPIMGCFVISMFGCLTLMRHFIPKRNEIEGEISP